MVAKSATKHLVVPIELIEQKIYFLRGHKVMIDSDLARLYQVPTKAFNQAVQRNKDRFPADFRFRLTKKEFLVLRSQTVTSKPVRGGRRYLPYVFTEQGVAMLSSVLNSKRAVHVNIAIMRVFVKLRSVLSSHEEFIKRLDNLEKRLHMRDQDIEIIFRAIRKLMTPVEESVREKREIGFKIS